MTKTFKNLFATQNAMQKGTVATLCIVYALFFTLASCDKQVPVLEWEDEEPATSQVKGEKTGEEEPPTEEEETPADEHPPPAEPEPPVQFYYWNYKNEKEYLVLNTRYIYLAVREPRIPEDIARRGFKAEEFRSAAREYLDPDKVYYYYTELSMEETLSDKVYLELLADIKSKNSDVILGPYFNINEAIRPHLLDNKWRVGASHIFYVKLKDLKDVKLLEQMAEQMGCVILLQDHYMPLWFVMSITEASELNGLEMANFFHECGLFGVGEFSPISFEPYEQYPQVSK